MDSAGFERFSALLRRGGAEASGADSGGLDRFRELLRTRVGAGEGLSSGFEELGSS